MQRARGAYFVNRHDTFWKEETFSFPKHQNFLKSIKISSRKSLYHMGRRKIEIQNFEIFDFFRLFWKSTFSKSQIFGFFMFGQKISKHFAKLFFICFQLFCFFSKTFQLFFYNLVRCLVCRFRTFLQGFEALSSAYNRTGH